MNWTCGRRPWEFPGTSDRTDTCWFGSDFGFPIAAQGACDLTFKPADAATIMEKQTHRQGGRLYDWRNGVMDLQPVQPRTDSRQGDAIDPATVAIRSVDQASSTEVTEIPRILDPPSTVGVRGTASNTRFA
jgi:hypothetical protein